MTYTEFLSYFKNILYKNPNKSEYCFHADEKEPIFIAPQGTYLPGLYDCQQKDRKFEGQEYLFWVVKTGGGEAESYLSEERVDFKDLDKVLEVIHPNISYLKYKQIMSLIEKEEITEYEYYGNYSNYDYHLLDAKKFYDLIKEDLE